MIEKEYKRLLINVNYDEIILKYLLVLFIGHILFV